MEIDDPPVYLAVVKDLHVLVEAANSDTQNGGAVDMESVGAEEEKFQANSTEVEGLRERVLVAKAISAQALESLQEAKKLSETTASKLEESKKRAQEISKNGSAQLIELQQASEEASMERDKLPALEFLMSKQPHVVVRMNANNSVGARVTNVFVDAERFLEKLRKKKQKVSKFQVRAERMEVEGYTGQPLYSKWFSPAEEDRAIFVDEVKCVGCLKCALLAPKTFAIETAHGQARAIGQWAESEETVSDAIQACPINCISLVERQHLMDMAALMLTTEELQRVKQELSLAMDLRTLFIAPVSNSVVDDCATEEGLKWRFDFSESG